VVQFEIRQWGKLASLRDGRLSFPIWLEWWVGLLSTTIGKPLATRQELFPRPPFGGSENGGPFIRVGDKPSKWIGIRRVRFTTTAGLVNELVEASSRQVTFPGGSVRESWAAQAQASCGTAQGNWRGKRGGRFSYYWAHNLTAATPLYERAETLFEQVFTRSSKRICRSRFRRDFSKARSSREEDLHRLKAAARTSHDRGRFPPAVSFLINDLRHSV
jgi:hypothetical protein